MGVFGSSGVRGIVNDDLTPGFVERLAAVTGTEWQADRIALGRDTRLSGPMLENAVAAGFMSAGVDVERVGVIPTPGLQDYLHRTDQHGCMITASHNPREYNGIKLFEAGGRELSGEGLSEIEHAIERGSRRRVSWDRTGEQLRIDNVASHYISGIVEAVDTGVVADAGLTVAVDPGHGASSETTPILCRDLGCRVVTVNATPDGRFPSRSPEPVPAVLEDLQRLVLASEADIGVAHDGDGDRAMFVDETGTVVDGNTMLAILADAFVEEGDTVVSAVNVSNRVEDAVEAAGGRLERTPIGSAQVIERIAMCKERGDRVPLAGESNGGIFLPEDREARDGALVLARVLELLSNRSLKERAEAHAEYHLERRAIRYSSPDERRRMLSQIEEADEAGEATVDRTDGIRLDYPDGWVLARPSGTEPLIRVTAEARDRERAFSYLDRMMRTINAE